MSAYTNDSPCDACGFPAVSHAGEHPTEARCADYTPAPCEAEDSPKPHGGAVRVDGADVARCSAHQKVPA
jgi:hypothetical protein